MVFVILTAFRTWAGGWWMFMLPMLVVTFGCKNRAPDVLTPDRVWFGQQEQDEAGRELDVGVLDEAGFASVLVGTPSSSHEPDARTGGAYLLDRDTPGGILDEVAIATFTGAVGNDFGRDVALVGDLTGDGRRHPAGGRGLDVPDL